MGPAPAADGSEPERPAPSVTLTPSGAGENPAAVNAAAAPAVAAPTAAAQTDTTARWLGGAGLLVGALGLGVGSGAVLRSRRSAGSER